MPLTDAFIQAKTRLGSRELAVRDLTKHARARHLTVAARWILPDWKTERCVIFRSVFWQHYVIDRGSSFDNIHNEVAIVRPLGRLPGSQWFFFVGRRRFERLYSTTRRDSSKQAYGATAVAANKTAAAGKIKTARKEDSGLDVAIR